ncbi:MAG TPA: hypothetical protein VMO47_15080 [Rhodothermales bacterium]|nr:hypothetical protein [Rhodothermales bacterium]
MIKSLNWLDYIVVVGYLLVLLGVGVYVARFNRRAEDYFKGGGHIPWLLSCISLFVSGFSAFMFVGAAGFTYRNGLSALLLFSSAFPAYFLGYFLYGRLWRRTRIDTPMQFLSRRFSPSTTYFYTLLSVVPQILMLGISIYTLCIFISSALGFNELTFDFGFTRLSGLEASMVATGFVLVVYTLLGGLWAVVVTDALQFVILLLASLIIMPIAFIHLGDGNIVHGVERLIDEAPPGFFDVTLDDRPQMFWMAYLVGIVMGYNVNWHIAQRYYSVADERDTKKMALWSAVLSLILPVLWILPVMASRVLYPELESMWPTLADPTEASFVTLALSTLPHGMLGVMVAAMLAATMSSADTTFNWLAAVLTKDVYLPVSRTVMGKPPSESSQVFVGRLSVAVMGIIAIWVALTMERFGGSFDVNLKAQALYASSMFVPVMIGIVYTRTPWWSAIASFGSGVAAVITVGLLANATQGLPADSLADLFLDVNLTVLGVELTRYELQVLTGAGVASLVLLASAAFRRRTGGFKERIEALEADLATPAHFPESDRVDMRGLAALRITARLTMILGAMLAVITLLTLEEENGELNFVAGILCLTIGYGITYFANRQERKYDRGSSSVHDGV